MTMVFVGGGEHPTASWRGLRQRPKWRELRPAANPVLDPGSRQRSSGWSRLEVEWSQYFFSPSRAQGLRIKPRWAWKNSPPTYWEPRLCTNKNNKLWARACFELLWKLGSPSLGLICCEAKIWPRLVPPLFSFPFLVFQLFVTMFTFHN